MTHGPWTFTRSKYDACIAAKTTNFRSNLDQVWSLLETDPEQAGHRGRFIMLTLCKQLEIGPHTAALFTKFLQAKSMTQLECSQIECSDDSMLKSVLASPPSSYRTHFLQQALQVKGIRHELKQKELLHEIQEACHATQ